MTKQPDQQPLDVNALRERYTAEPVPPCAVCGAPLSLQACGGGEPSVWACDARAPERRPADEHYCRSEFVQRRTGDPDVVAACDAIVAMREKLMQAELQEHLRLRLERGDAVYAIILRVSAWELRNGLSVAATRDRFLHQIGEAIEKHLSNAARAEMERKPS